MENKDFYSWRAIFPNDQIYYRGGIKLNELKPPFTFELIPLDCGLKKLSIDVNVGQELIYFRRVFNTFNTLSKKNNIRKILYCFGFKENNKTSVTWINPITKKIKREQGENIIL